MVSNENQFMTCLKREIIGQQTKKSHNYFVKHITMGFAKAVRKIFFPSKKNKGNTNGDVLAVVHCNTPNHNMAAPSSPTDVHKCCSFTCIACSKPGSVVFVKADESHSLIKQYTKSDKSQASTEPSTPSSSQRTLTPPPPINRKKILFENISEVGVIRAYLSSNNVVVKEVELCEPYELTRGRSVSYAGTLNKFVESIETATSDDDTVDTLIGLNIEMETSGDDDVDRLIFGTPWEKK